MSEARQQPLPVLDDVAMEGEEAQSRGLDWARTGRPDNPLLHRLLARIENPEALWPQEIHDRLLDLIQDAIHQAVDARRADIDELLRARLYRLVRELDDGDV